MEQTIQQKCAAALRELIAMCMDAGMSTHEMVPIFEEELRRFRGDEVKDMKTWRDDGISADAT